MPMIAPVSIENTFFERIPPLDLEPHQVAVTQYGVLPTFRMSRTPSTIDELAQYNREVVIAMENRTLLLFQSLNVFSEDLYLPHIVHTKCLFLYFHLNDDTVTSCQICGDSEENILDTALLFARLPVSDELEMTQIMMRCFNLNCTARHSEKVTTLIDVFATKTIRVVHSQLNDILSAAFASRPYPIDFSLLMSSVDIHAFTEQLQARTTQFGSLGFAGTENDNHHEENLRQMFHHLDLFENFHMSKVPDNLILKLLTAPLKSIAFATLGQTGRLVLPATTVICPTEVCVMIDTVETGFPTQFMISFLQQLAKSNNLVRFGFRLMEEHPVPVDVTRALCGALAASTNLTILELTGCIEEFGIHLQDVLAALERHVSLRTLRLLSYPLDLDPNVTWLKRLLRRNRYIEVIDLPILDGDDEIDEIYAVTRFFHGSKRLLGEPSLTRQLLVKAALMENAESDLERTGVLLNDHTDLLCELLQDTV